MKNQQLSKREIEMAHLTCLGKSQKEIATMLFISPHTVATTKKNIHAKLKINKATELALWYITHHLNIGGIN